MNCIVNKKDLAKAIKRAWKMSMNRLLLLAKLKAIDTFIVNGAGAGDGDGDGDGSGKLRSSNESIAGDGSGYLRSSNESMILENSNE
jgi:hypothetical protein